MGNKEEKKSLIRVMKDQINTAGKARADVFYVKKDNKTRVRFLTEMTDGVQILFHEKWKEFGHPCLKYYNKICPNCGNSESKDNQYFAFTVWNYENKKRELFIYKANNYSPMPHLVSMYEEYDTICDRDYVISRLGSESKTAYTVMPLDRKPFKGDEIEFTEKEIFKLALKAYPCEEAHAEDDEDDEPAPKKSASKNKKYDDDEDEDEVPVKKSKSKPKYDDDDDEDEEEERRPAKKLKKPPVDEDEDDEDDEPPAKKPKAKVKAKPVEDDDEEDDEPDFAAMDGDTLKKECKKRGFDIKGRSRKEVIQMLEDDLPF